ncbi:MAG TPA: family 16 glycoside hydrolase [Thermomicrobiales bacterium]
MARRVPVWKAFGFGILILVTSGLLPLIQPQSTLATPKLTLVPGTAPPGALISVRGAGFPARARGTIVWTAGGTTIATLQTDSRGRFSKSVRVPRLPGGDYALQAIVGDVSASAVLTVTEKPSPSAMPTRTPTRSPTPSRTPTPTKTPTPRPTRAPTAAPTASPGQGSGAVVSDGFETYPTARWREGTTHGPWQVVYDGYGQVGIEDNGSRVLSERPLASTGQAETHAGLVVSNDHFGDFTLSVRLRTVQQLRSPLPNQWETAWVLWHYTDDTHFYYFVLKTNGWELGKEDGTRRDPDGPACDFPAYVNCLYPGAQRFFATGHTPAVAPGQWHEVRVRQVGTTMTVWVDGSPVVTFTDTLSPYPSGAVGLYTEDAYVQFDDVVITVPGA